MVLGMEMVDLLMKKKSSKSSIQQCTLYSIYEKRPSRRTKLIFWIQHTPSILPVGTKVLVEEIVKGWKIGSSMAWINTVLVKVV